MRIVLTGGGTGGHLGPLLALHEQYQSIVSGTDTQTKARMRLPWEWLYIGSRQGVESKVIPEHGIRSEFVLSGKFRRYFSLATILAPLQVMTGIVQSWMILRRFKPHVVFCSGGYVSFPVAWAARLSGIPVILHEQTVSMGLSNRLISRFAHKILLSYPATVAECERGACSVVGNPVRLSLLRGDRKKGLELLGFSEKDPVILVMGGAQGCHFLNESILSDLPRWLESCQLVIAAGDNPDYQRFKDNESQLLTAQRRRLRVFSYLNEELAHIEMAADLVISRFGAGTIAELIALKKPGILVPLPASAGGEQTKNALMLEKIGGALVLPQLDLNSERLYQAARALLYDREHLTRMSRALGSLVNGDPSERIMNEIISVVSSHRRQ